MQSKTNLVEKDEWMTPIGVMGYEVHSTLSDFGSVSVFLKALNNEKNENKISILTLDHETVRDKNPPHISTLTLFLVSPKALLLMEMLYLTHIFITNPFILFAFRTEAMQRSKYEIPVEPVFGLFSRRRFSLKKLTEKPRALEPWNSTLSISWSLGKLGKIKNYQLWGKCRKSEKSREIP